MQAINVSLLQVFFCIVRAVRMLCWEAHQCYLFKVKYAGTFSIVGSVSLRKLAVPRFNMLLV